MNPTQPEPLTPTCAYIPCDEPTAGGSPWCFVHRVVAVFNAPSEPTNPIVRLSCSQAHPDADVYHPGGHPVESPSNLSQGEDTEYEIASFLLPLLGQTVTTKDETLFVVNPTQLIAALQARDTRIVREAEERGKLHMIHQVKVITTNGNILPGKRLSILHDCLDDYKQRLTSPQTKPERTESVRDKIRNRLGFVPGLNDKCFECGHPFIWHQENDWCYAQRYSVTGHCPCNEFTPQTKPEEAK